MARRSQRPIVDRIERYREAIDDWDAFRAATERPMPTVVRTHTDRLSPDRLRKRLECRGIDCEAVPWADAFLRVDRPVGRTIEHWLGMLYIQELVQAVPVLVLDPRPEELVLDLCAAPGGKTTHIAALMKSSGTLIANEPNGRRQQGLLANVNRLGAINVAITEYAGEAFPMSIPFDRILVDAPCSAEGTLRKERSLRHGAAPAAIRRLSALQRRLIVRAYDLLRPGGVLVYSTCTFAPEENEASVAHLLAERPDARLTPVALPFAAAPGLTEWNGTRFSPELTGCARIYPHHLDSGGGFVARIERPG